MPSTEIDGRFYGTGRRKTAIARVFVAPGDGKITINGRELHDYFPREVSAMIVEQPFETVSKVGQFNVNAMVRGGGVAAQAEAVRHGITRALVNSDMTLKTPLKKAGFVTRDSREKERKKPGQPGARKRFQFSKR